MSIYETIDKHYDNIQNIVVDCNICESQLFGTENLGTKVHGPAQLNALIESSVIDHETLCGHDDVHVTIEKRSSITDHINYDITIND